MSDSFATPWTVARAFQMALAVKNTLAGNIRDVGLILGSGRSPGGGHGNPLQYLCLENRMDRGAWRALVHGVAESDKTEATSHGCMDCSLPGSSDHGVLQARILKRVAISLGKGSFQPRDQTYVSCIAGRFFPTEPPGKPSWVCVQMYKFCLNFLLDLLCSGLLLPFLFLPAIL